MDELFRENRREGQAQGAGSLLKEVQEVRARLDETARNLQSLAERWETWAEDAFEPTDSPHHVSLYRPTASPSS